MTAVDTTRPDTRGEWSRVVSVMRLHFVNIGTIIVIPWVIMAVIFFANLAIWLAIELATDADDDVPEQIWSGGVVYIFVYMLVVAIQAINATFPYAQGLSVTRRDYALGTGLAFVVLAAGYAVALSVLSVIEDATGGWGLGGRVFAAFAFGDDTLLDRLLVNFLGLLFFFFIGSLFGAMWVRWRLWGVLSLTILLVVLLVGATFGITIADAWPTVAEWFVSTGPIGLALWTLLPTVIAAVAGFFILRRATPRT